MKKIMITLASLLCVSSHSYACDANVYFTQTVASGEMYGPAQCGKVNPTQKWSPRCVNRFIDAAYWHGNISAYLSPAQPSSHFTYGIISYFLVEYSPSLCRGDIVVNQEDAMLIGSSYKDGRQLKLYGVFSNTRNFNIPVFLSRGITLLFQR